MNNTERALFHCWRILFGLFLMSLAATIYPYVSELVGHSTNAPRWGRLVFLRATRLDAEVTFRILLSIQVVASLCLVANQWKRVVAGILAATLLIKSLICPIIASPEVPLVLYLLMIETVVPGRERLKDTPNTAKLLRLVNDMAWVGILLLFSIGGFFKLFSLDKSWIRGEAVFHILTESEFRRDWLTSPTWVTLPVSYALTYSSVALEIGAVIFIFWRRGRILWWWAALFLNLGIFACLDIFPVSAGILLYQFYLIKDSGLITVWEKISLSRPGNLKRDKGNCETPPVDP